MQTTHICERCGKNFKQKSHLDDHLKRKRPCKKDDTLTKLIEEKVEEKVSTRIMELLETGNERTTQPVNVVKRTRSKLTDAKNTYEITANKLQLIQSVEDKLELLCEITKPREIEKTQFGEVFTPRELRKDMTNKLKDVNPLIYTIPTLKFFDPCVGYGNFMATLFERLMIGLIRVIPDEHHRMKHILENMLYMCELNKHNALMCKKILDKENKFNLNIYCGSFLELDTKDVWGVEKFDVIIGNPPYNSPGTKSSGNTIWQVFVKNSLSILKDNGYLVLVHPPGWRKPNTERGKFYGLFKKMAKNNQMKYLSIHGIKDGNTTFRCGTRYDWYVIKRTHSTENTLVNDEKGVEVSVNMRELEWLPNYKIDVVMRLLAKVDEERCPIIYNRSNYGSDKSYTSRIQTDEYKFPVIHTIPKSGIRYLYSSINTNGHYGISKVLFGDNGLNDAIIDMSGEYATSENSMSIQVNSIEEATRIKNTLLTTQFKEFIKACIIGNFRIDWRLFTYFKKDFWKEFG